MLCWSRPVISVWHRLTIFTFLEKWWNHNFYEEGCCLALKVVEQKDIKYSYKINDYIKKYGNNLNTKDYKKFWSCLRTDPGTEEFLQNHRHIYNIKDPHRRGDMCENIIGHQYVQLGPHGQTVGQQVINIGRTASSLWGPLWDKTTCWCKVPTEVVKGRLFKMATPRTTEWDQYQHQICHICINRLAKLIFIPSFAKGALLLGC